MKNYDWVLVFAIVIGLLLAGTKFVNAIREGSRACSAPHEATWAPPDVSLCPAGGDLWECIRDVRYVRTDI